MTTFYVEQFFLSSEQEVYTLPRNSFISFENLSLPSGSYRVIDGELFQVIDGFPPKKLI